MVHRLTPWRGSRARLVSYWFDPRVCLVSSGSICVDHLIYALIAIADAGHGSDLSFDMGVRNVFLAAALNPARAVLCAFRLLVHNVLKEAPLAHDARALLLFGLMFLQILHQGG